MGVQYLTIDGELVEQLKIQNILLCNIYVVLATQNQEQYFTGEDCFEKFLNVVRTVDEKCCDVIILEDEEKV